MQLFIQALECHHAKHYMAKTSQMVWILRKNQKHGWSSISHASIAKISKIHLMFHVPQLKHFKGMPYEE